MGMCKEPYFMSSLKFWAFSSILLFFMACGDGNPEKMFSIRLDKDEFHRNEKVPVAIENKRDKEIEAVHYFIDGKELPLQDHALTLDVEKLGSKTLVARVTFEGNSVEVPRKITVLADKAPTLYTYEILHEYPHDAGAFTQGLEFHRDTLYESTGKKGASSIRKVDFETGKILKKIDLEPNYFGEGITLLDGKLYQLTWQAGIGFVYDGTTLKRTGNFQYGQSKEGWGLCNDGDVIYKSDGTEKIWLLNPETQFEVGHLEIVTNTSMFNKANELEYVDGKIYANVWQKESMMIIDAQSGAISGVVNFGGLREKVTQTPQLDVLNGVAYHPCRKTFFVTGKYWDKLFEVRIIPKE